MKNRLQKILSCITFTAIIIFFFCFFVNQSEAIEALFKKDSFTIGQTAVLNINFKLPDGSTISDNPEIIGLDDFDIISKKVTSKGMEIEIFVDKPDGINIPPLTLIYYDSMKNKKKLQTDPVQAKVIATITEKPENNLLHPLKDIISTESRIKKIHIIIFSALFLCIVFFLVYYLYMRKKNKEHTASYQTVPPHEKALNDISFLIKEGLPDTRGIKSFYFKLSEILREYLGSIRGFNALEMTTDEIARRVVDNNDRELVFMLKNMDRIKFSDFFLNKQAIQKDIDSLFDYINNTITEPLDLSHDNGRAMER